MFINIAIQLCLMQDYKGLAQHEEAKVIKCQKFALVSKTISMFF